MAAFPGSPPPGRPLYACETIAMSSGLLVLALLAVSVSCGFAVSSVFFPRNSSASVVLKLGLSFGIWSGLTSMLFFVWSLIFNPTYYPHILLLLEVTIAVLAMVVVIRGKGTNPLAQEPAGHQRTDPSWWTIALVLVLALVFLYSLDSFMSTSGTLPYGQWDAWAIWNLRARFIYLGGTEWRNAFWPSLAWSHPDYPLLLPNTIAGMWAILGPTKAVPYLIAVAYFYSTALLLCGALWATRGINHALVGTIVLLSTPTFWLHASFQYADVPLSFYYLACCILLYLSHATRDAKLNYLLGFVAGLAAWTKNEGLSLLVSITIVSFIDAIVGVLRGAQRTSLLRLCRTLIGLAVPLMVILLFKIQLAPPNDLLGGQTVSTMLGKAATFARYLQIIRADALMFLKYGSGGTIPVLPLLIAYLLICGRAPLSLTEGASLRQGILMLILTFGQYMVVYVIAPNDLAWQLSTSLDRLFTHLYPSAMFLLFMIVANYPEHGHSLPLSERGKVQR